MCDLLDVHTIWIGDNPPPWVWDGVAAIHKIFFTPHNDSKPYFRKLTLWHLGRSPLPNPIVTPEILQALEVHETEDIHKYIISEFYKRISNVPLPMYDFWQMLLHLATNNSPSAVKDVLELLLLYLYGGLYLDLSVMFVPLWKLPNSRPLWAPTDNQNIMFPIISKRYCIRARSLPPKMGRNPWGIIGKTEHNHFFNSDGSLRDRADNGEAVCPNIDVWALFSLPKEPIMAAAGFNYISTLNSFLASRPPFIFLPLDMYLSSIKTKTKSSVAVALDESSQDAPIHFLSLPTNSLDTNKSKRNTLIGSLILISLIDAILANYNPSQQIPWNTMAWVGYTSKCAGKGFIFVPDLMLMKEYKNSWRK